MNKLFKVIVGLFLAVCIIGFMNTAWAASKEKLVKTGNALFASGKFDEAIRTYDEAAVDDPESPVIYFNKGAALYKKEDFAAARDAFQKAAIKTKDIALEAKSRFNLGLCFFREGDRQKDSDLKKALESYESSVQSFQEALTLDPKFTEAAENIELVRLMMKSVLDEIKKQEEDARKQQEKMQQAAATIKNLIEKQKNLLDESQSLIKREQAKRTEDASTDKNQHIADAQKQLKNETQNFSEELAKQAAPPAGASSAASSNKGAPPAPDHPSKQHLDASVGEQENAISRLADNDTHTAADNQQKSLDDLNKALEALNNGQTNPQCGQQQPEQQQQQQQQQQGNPAQHKENGQQQKDPKEQNQESSAAAEETQAPEQKTPDQSQQPMAVQLSDDANNILDEEKENQKQRTLFSPGDFKNVDKDW